MLTVKGTKDTVHLHQDGCAWQLSPTPAFSGAAVQLTILAAQTAFQLTQEEKYQAELVQQHKAQRIPGMRQGYVEGSPAGLEGNTTWFQHGLMLTLIVRLAYLWTNTDNTSAIALTRLAAPHVRPV